VIDGPIGCGRAGWCGGGWPGAGDAGRRGGPVAGTATRGGEWVSGAGETSRKFKRNKMMLSSSGSTVRRKALAFRGLRANLWVVRFMGVERLGSGGGWLVCAVVLHPGIIGRKGGGERGKWKSVGRRSGMGFGAGRPPGRSLSRDDGRWCEPPGFAGLLSPGDRDNGLSRPAPRAYRRTGPCLGLPIRQPCWAPVASRLGPGVVPAGRGGAVRWVDWSGFRSAAVPTSCRAGTGATRLSGPPAMALGSPGGACPGSNHAA
jgi:hypothetical protein